MPIKDMACQEGCLTLYSALNRITVLRDALSEPPFASLDAMLSYLLQGDAFAAAKEYHALTYALLTGGYRRVSGDLWRDFLLWVLTERENPFSALAARNVWDEPLAGAMRGDLKRMDVLFSLNSVIAKKWIGEKLREQRSRPRTQQHKDNISVLSSAVWSGSTPRSLPQGAPAAIPANVPEPLPLPIDENDFLSWRYQPEEAREPYAADGTLEELYRRLDTSADRGLLLDDLWNLFATCGTGAFTRYRIFTVERGGTLSGMPLAVPEEDAFTFYHRQREQALHNVIRFMRGEQAQNLILTGGAGTGKSTQVFSLARELPELRLVFCPPGRMEAAAAALPVLAAQPLKFLLFLDEFDPGDPAWPALRSAVAPGGFQQENLLAVAAARQAEDAFFPLRITLPPPQLKDFIELVQMQLLRAGKDIDFDSIQNACIDYAAAAGVNGGSPLSFRSAAAIADGLANE